MVLDHDDGLRVERRSGISVVPARTRGKLKDSPELFFPCGLTPLSDGLESQPCHMYQLGTGVRDADRLIESSETPHVTSGFQERQPRRRKTPRRQLCKGEGDGNKGGAPPYGRASSQVLN